MARARPAWQQHESPAPVVLRSAHTQTDGADWLKMVARVASLTHQVQSSAERCKKLEEQLKSEQRERAKSEAALMRQIKDGDKRYEELKRAAREFVLASEAQEK